MKFLPKTPWLRPEIVLLAIFSIIIHLAIRNNLEYHRDELLYFSLGMHPAAGYATVPPVIGWIAWLMKSLFGNSLFAVRLFPALLSAAMIFLCASLARELGGSRYSSLLAAVGLLISIFFMRTYGLFHPVHIEIFLWTLCIYMVVKYINTEKDKYLIYFGILAGISLLNKYLAAMLFAGFLVIIPFTEHRTIFRNRMFWTGILLGSIIFMPNLIWQIVKGFPVFHHMSELYDRQLVHMNFGLFLTEQLIMPFAGSVLTIAGLLFLLFRERMRRVRFLGFLALYIIIGLMLLKGKSYYTLGIFPLLIAAGAVSFDLWLTKGWSRVLLPSLLILITIPVIPIGLPIFDAKGLIEYFGGLRNKYGLDLGLRFEDGSIHSLPQDYADMLGWEEMAALAHKAYSSVEDKKAAFIYCENYGQAGAVTVIGKKYGLPDAVCFSESFLYWIPEKFDPDIKSLVYINDEPGDDIKALFRKITLVGRISDPDAREYGTGVFLCEEPVQSFNSFWIPRAESISGRRSSASAEGTAPLRVRMTPVVTKPVSLPVHTSGTLVTREEIKLSFKTGGIVSGILVREGDKVRKGDILATLNLLEIKANAEQAQAAYDKALRDFTRADTLWKQGSLSLERKQNAETALNLAKNTLEIARFNLMHSRIEAPDNGVIMKQFVRENELVSSGYPVFLFGALGKFWKVETSLTDRDVIRVRPGDSAVVTFDAWPGVQFPGRVDLVGEMSNPYTGTYETELAISDGGHRLASGFIASADIYTSERNIWTLVPAGSVLEADGSKGYIYIVPDGRHARKVMVGIAALTGNMAAVTGIPDGTVEIVSEGMAYLKDGAAVEIVK